MQLELRFDVFYVARHYALSRTDLSEECLFRSWVKMKQTKKSVPSHSNYLDFGACLFISWGGQEVNCFILF